MDIPTTKSTVHLDLLHPRFVKRLEAFFSDTRIKNRVRVSSACRSLAQQQHFFNLYRSGKGNLAADPRRRFGPKGLDGQGIWRGSWHMEQADGFCYAVDLAQVSKSLSKPDINTIATSYGVVPTIKAREWWHHQPRAGVDWFDAPALRGEAVELPDAPEPKMDWAGIVAAINAQKAEVARKPLTRGSRGGAVKTAQSRLGALGFDCGSPDGIFGRKTASAVKQFQRKRGITPTGSVNVETFDALFR